MPLKKPRLGSKMLCCVNAHDYDEREANLKREKKRIHDQIEKELKEDKKRRQKEIRVLLLGCGEAGKSTFIKQMRIIHSDGFSTNERMAIKTDIASNIVTAIQTLIQNTCGKWSDPGLEEESKAIELLPQRIDPLELLEQAATIKRLWESPEIQAAYANRNKFQLVECASYFLTKVDQILKSDYLPTNDDIVNARVKTTGIIEHDFEIVDAEKKTTKLIMIDVGGQRSERKKWIHCFEDVLLILFLTAISEYDQVLAEDETTNRMQESLLLFRTIVNYGWFRRTSIILFLNKMDILREKVEYSPVSDYFSDYEGPDNDAEAVKDFFTDRFSSLNPNPKERKLFIHETCATDTKNIKIIDTIVQSTIFDLLLESVNMIH